MKHFRESDYYKGINRLTKEKDYKTIRHYHLLKLKNLLGYKTFHIQSRNIGTQDKKITLNQEYQYREGSTLERVIVKDVKFKNFFLHVKFYFVDLDRTLTFRHTMAITGGYGASWRIHEIDFYDIEKWKKDEEALERGEVDAIYMERNWDKYPV